MLACRADIVYSKLQLKQTIPEDPGAARGKVDLRLEIEILRNSSSLRKKRVEVKLDPFRSNLPINVVEVNVQQVDEPWQLCFAENVHLHDLA